MKVSIIIPCYKQAHWLPDAIESALGQTYEDVEVIVVNDGSPDNTTEVAKKYGIMVVEKENGGLSSARNAGIKASSGDYILTLDADDKLAIDFIEETIGIDDIVGTGQQEFGDSHNYWSPRQHPKYEDFLQNNQINCCSLFKRECFDKCGGYDENNKTGYEDWQFWLKLAKNGYTFTTINKPLFFYRKHGKSMVDNAIAKHEELKQYILNNH